ncbi:anthranilate synthase component I [Alkalibacter mobilis]|uniref:anthranilate synthase component I n=1 Tax=Alkalibacter mobilis TaxID=2787712 RepID=UPI0018A116F3|nr:anthranilate synthase component I [Alkalibacter mobilis]MBF7096991.1 anthranilate synthase component I [Alkalibacter mobilis]
MIYPSKELYKTLKNTCTVIPFAMQIEGDTETPISLFKKLCREEKTFLLESVEGGSKWGRYSYIGRNLYGEIIFKEQQTRIITEDNEKIVYGKSIEHLKEFFRGISYPDIGMETMPAFTGGAVGYVAYDLVREIEKLPELNPDEMNTPDVHLMMMKEIIVYDHLKQKIFLIFNQFNQNASYEDSVGVLNEMENEIKENISRTPSDRKFQIGEFVSNETLDSFKLKVERAKNHIRQGDIFQVVLSQRLKAKTDMDPFAAYRKLRSVNPSPYLYYMNFGDYTVVGSSPELLVKVDKNMIETCPIAGTRPRGKTDEQDEIFAEELMKDEKERAEHLMLLDLARNDIGKVSEFGSVKVSQFMNVHRYSHVMHIVSNVIGKLRNEMGMFDALRACLPAGTLSGAPKVRAMEIIEDLETTRRGIYGGGVGYFGFNGNMDMCITIRTVVFKNGEAVVQAGAGIVADSDPESEFYECMNKAMALLETLKKAGEGK